ncbi:hypothetical protein LO762_15270 [Actinocorallia sp. API 0066]|uniref:hypothetical protein n=1 Tax=Actinocorallia sp. API 0066 TaxID=2896846 RepID=UPI001E28E4D1|nr:hypothetical protein [Actinocorallia sp. API 0066]MCD0450540.1 hypothetical protein [Actinocorallia sp. API 0066]
MNSSGVVVRLAVLAAVAAVAAGCSTAKTGEDGRPAVTPVPTDVRSLNEVRLPLEYYQATPEQAAALRDADDILVSDCMKRYGVRYPVRTHRPDVFDTEHRDRRFYYIPVGVAARYGYQLPKGVGEPTGDAGPRLTPDEINLLQGQGVSTFRSRPIPVEGCAGEARRRIADGVPAGVDPRYPMTLAAQAATAADADPRHLAVSREWSACMKKAGFDYRMADDPNNDPRWANDPGSALERRTAVADMKCKDAVRYVGVEYAVVAEHENQFIEDNFEALTEVKGALDRMMENAAAIVGGNLPPVPSE